MTKQEEIREGLIKELGKENRCEAINYLCGGDCVTKYKTCSECATDIALRYLHSQGVVIKVERELPKVTYGLSREYYRAYGDAQSDMSDAGYEAVVPLKEE